MTNVDKLMMEYHALLKEGYSKEEAERYAFMIVYGYAVKEGK